MFRLGVITMATALSPSGSGCVYTVFRYVVDAGTDHTEPVGVGVSVPDQGCVFLRFIQPGERRVGLPGKGHLPYVDMTRREIESWVQTGRTPYGPPGVGTGSAEWWYLVRDLLGFRVRASEPRVVDCRAPEEDVESLFDAVVGADAPLAMHQERIEGQLSRALGPLDRSLSKRERVRGYADREVRVMRAAPTAKGLLLIDAVNLSSAKSAEHDADALASKLCRVREGEGGGIAEIIVAYRASPGGLNGEAAMRDWMQEHTGARMYDMVAQRDGLREHVGRSLQSLLDQTVMDF
jgi:hypothetical protein